MLARGQIPGRLLLGLPLTALPAAALLIAAAARSTAQETWTPTSTVGVPSARYVQTAVWTGARMIVWGGQGETSELNSGGTYDAATNTWTATSLTNAPTSRVGHTAVWTGSQMIVWGGRSTSANSVNSGGIYELATNTWKATSRTNAPWARSSHTAVWTGSKMIVWGGWDPSDRGVNTGGLYDPAADTWTATTTTNAPTGRTNHAAVWTGSHMIVWGGFQSLTGWLNTGGVYDPATDTWVPTSTAGAPEPRSGFSVVWTGSKMIVWGGHSADWVSTGALYDPATDTWTPTTPAAAPEPRTDHSAVWTGSKMIVFGGSQGFRPPSCLFPSCYLSVGGAFDPEANTWTATSATSAPTGRTQHAAIWTGSRMVVWGGATPENPEGPLVPLGTGGVYSNPALLPPPPSPAELHTVSPCRLVDTRNAAGPSGGPALLAGAVRSFRVAGGVCGIPSSATAVSVNVTVVGAVASGYLILYQGDVGGPPPASSLNFTAGVTRANNAVVRLAANGGTINVKNRSAGSVHFVLDISGYFQ